jgi:drug/metabolite transporter (DMT)-like permease
VAGLSAPATGVLLGLLAPVLWSSSGLFVKLLTLDALPIAGLRALIAGLALAPLLRPAGLRVNGALLLMLAGYTASVAGYVAAVKLTTVANAIALVSTAPAWVLLMSWAAARRVIWTLAWPVLLILAGVGALLSEPAVGRSLEGNLIALGAGAGFGVFTFFLPRVHLSGPGLVSLCNLVAAAVILPIAAQGIDPGRIAAWEWAALVYLGVVQIGLATLCFAAALRRIPAMQGSILALLEPLLAPLWVYLAIGELPSAHGAAGFAFILAGILADFLLRRRQLNAPAGGIPGGGETRASPRTSS